MDCSVVIPVYNEADNIEPLFAQLTPALTPLGNYEIIFVDDGSTDGTFERIKTLHHKNKQVRCISFRRNLGKTAALMAGFRAVLGKVVVTIDGDLQNDPMDIPDLVPMLKDIDVVSGWRQDRKDSWFRKKLPSRISNAISRWLTGLPLHDFNCPLKVYRKEAVEGLDLQGDMHRYIPAVLAWQGFLVGEARVRHYKRQHGSSKYGLGRLFRGFFDLINFKFWAGYSTRPLHFFGKVGSLVLSAGLVVNFYLLLLKVLYGEQLSQRPLLLLGILLMIIGLQIVFLGFLAEIMIRNYYTHADCTIYTIREIL